MSTPSTPSTALTVRRQALAAAAAAIDETSQLAMEHFENGAGSFAAELQVATAMNDLRKILTHEVMEPVMALMNTDLGFRTDKDPNQVDFKTGRPHVAYSVDVVREVFIESKLRGFHTVGNEFNIIAGRFYGCKNGFRRKVTKFKGITEFKDNYDVPRVVGDKGALVKAKATWKLNGAPDSIECEIPVKVNASMGTDAMLGKAERKLLKRVHDRLTGMNTPDGESGEDYTGGPTIEAETTRARPNEATAQAVSEAPPAPAPRARRTAEAVASAVVQPAPPKAAPAPMPEPEPEPEPIPVAVAKMPATPQQQVEDLLVKYSIKFDDFRGWLVTTGGLTEEEASSVGSCEDLDAKFCTEELLSMNARALRKCATLYGTPV